MSDSDGQSIVDLLHGKPAASKRNLVWKTGAHQELGRKSWQAVREGDWKWVRAPEQSGELFDLKQDPQATIDLSSEHPEIAQPLAALAEQS